MKPSQKYIIRPIILLIVSFGLIAFFYVIPGFSNNLWTTLYNVFSACVVLGAVILYTLAIRDAYSIRALNVKRMYPGENKKWVSLWELYQSNFLANQKKTTAIAQSYFNPDNLLAASTERIPVLAILKSMPGTFTGLGILGTFMGFSAGLSNFNTRSIETMQASIKTLLAGINTAFNTSIVGVVLSIIFNFIFLQPLLKRLEQDCNSLTDRLDQEFYVDSTDYLKEIFSFEEDGILWNPRDYNRQSLKELKSHTISLANFTTDLSDSIQNLAESLVASYRQEMSRIITDDLQPTLIRLAASAEKLQAEKAESTDQALEGIINRLNATLNDFMKDFQENVAGQTKKEMEGIAGQLKTAGDSIGKIPEIMTEVRSSFTAMTDQNLKAMNEVALQGSSLQSESIAELKILADQVKVLMESYSRTLAAAERQNLHAEKVASSLEDAADAAASAVNDLRRAFSDFQAQNENLVNKIASEAENLHSALESVQAASQGFQGLDESLAKNFEAINNGLRDYQETTKVSLEKYLESYAGAFSQFASRLSGAVEQLGEMVEDLQSTIEKRK